MNCLDCMICNTQYRSDVERADHVDSRERLGDQDIRRQSQTQDCQAIQKIAGKRSENVLEPQREDFSRESWRGRGGDLQETQRPHCQVTHSRYY